MFGIADFGAPVAALLAFYAIPVLVDRASNRTIGPIATTITPLNL
ncbi:MAG: hypothetical protein ABWZ88_19745 [Variovorax sp.]